MCASYRNDSLSVKYGVRSRGNESEAYVKIALSFIGLGFVLR